MLNFRIKRVKRIMVTSLSMMVCFSAGAYASDGIQQVKAFLRPDFNVEVNHEKVELKQPVLIYDNRAYLPFNSLGELLDADIQWKDSTNTISIMKNAEGGSDIGGSGGNGNGAGTGSGVNEGTGDAGSTEQSDNDKQYPSEIQFANVLRYQATLNEFTFPILANYFEDTLYFRLSDLTVTGIDFSGLKTVKEKYTKQVFIPVDQVKKRWSKSDNFQLLNNPIITGEPDTDKQKALKGITTFNNAKLFYAKPTGSPNEYECLGLSGDSRYYIYIVKLAQYQSGVWSTAGMQGVNIYP